LEEEYLKTMKDNSKIRESGRKMINKMESLANKNDYDISDHSSKSEY
jgi:hypothetical protein